MKLLTYNDAIQNLINKHNLSSIQSIEKLISDHKILKTETLKEQLAALTKENRLLRVGIIGRVKSGKSSLLNALVFNGCDVLPKAATPMTAALTKLVYSEHEVRAEIDFYSEEDIREIKQKATDYKKSLDEKTKAHLNELKSKKSKLDFSKNDEKLKAQARQSAEMEMSALPDLQASFEQNQKIENASISLKELEQKSQINAQSTADLMGELKHYVGSNGKYMPFTKSVTLHLPEKGLQGLEVVDTPGVNDPVASREERTKEFLNQCDVVLVVSPAGQFLSQEDIDLMARVTTREGIQETYIIASQIDNQLFGSEKIGETTPIAVLEKITQKLGKHADYILNKQAKNHTEMENVLELYKKNNIICTSSIAYALNKKMKHSDELDEYTQHLWRNLNQSYPDFFNNTDPQSTLERLANIKSVNLILDDIKKNKDDIQLEKQKNFEMTTRANFKKFISNTQECINDYIFKIEDADIDTIRSNLNKLKQAKEDLHTNLDARYKVLTSDMGKLKINLIDALNEYISNIQELNQTQIEVEMDTYTVSTSRWYNPFSWGGKEERARHLDIDTIQADQVKSSINTNIKSIERKLNQNSSVYRENWHERMIKSISETARLTAPDVIERHELNIVTDLILADMPLPDFYIKTRLPKNIKKASGKLKGSEAREFVTSVDDYMNEQLIPDIREDISSYVGDILERLETYPLSEELLRKVIKNIEAQESDVNNKQESIERYESILSELEKTVIQ